MEKKYIYKVEKLTVNKMKGFTLIEMLFILQIICILELFVLPYANKNIVSSEVVIQNIYLMIENARMDAIHHHQTIELEFLNHSIHRNNLLIYENSNVLFDDSVNISFNNKGHIRQAKTVYFSINKKEYKLIFNLGQGVYRIEKV